MCDVISTERETVTTLVKVYITLPKSFSHKSLIKRQIKTFKKLLIFLDLRFSSLGKVQK